MSFLSDISKNNSNFVTQDFNYFSNTFRLAEYSLFIFFSYLLVKSAVFSLYQPNSVKNNLLQK